MLVEYEALTNSQDNYSPIPINEAHKYNNEEAVNMLEQNWLIKSLA